MYAAGVRDGVLSRENLLNTDSQRRSEPQIKQLFSTHTHGLAGAPRTVVVEVAGGGTKQASFYVSIDTAHLIKSGYFYQSNMLFEGLTHRSA